MEQYYTDERNVQILIALLKAHGIKQVIASPGSANVTFVGSLQQDPWFEMYSCVDERSAAYMACGMAAESGEPVVLSCTGATASRNYFPALTEAFYRKLPILAVTSTQEESKIGHLIPQVIDRHQQPSDIVKCSEHLQTVKDEDDEWNVTLKANRANLELDHHGRGPVHINLTTRYSHNFSIRELPSVKVIHRYLPHGKLPPIHKRKTAVYIGSHSKWKPEDAALLEAFCHAYNAVAFCDATANYHGKYCVNYNLPACQSIADTNKNPDLLIHIGDMSDEAGMVGTPKEVWRVCQDGKLSDRYGKLSAVFEMSEGDFWSHYVAMAKEENGDDSYLMSCLNMEKRILGKLPELPFSHIYVASRLHDKIPENSVMHLGILSPLRSWSYFRFHPTVDIYCNQGGFGIDGNLSSLIGASLIHPEKLYFGVVGDLSFFYDINSLGNRHIGNNLRVLLINNSLGAEFLLFKQTNIITCVNDIESYISAENHFGNQSSVLVRHYAEDLGFEYLSASSKEEFDKVYPRFVTPELAEKSMIFEVFTHVKDENDALKRMWNIEIDKSLKGTAKKVVKFLFGHEGMNNTIKFILKK